MSMLVEQRTYTLKPGKVGQFVEFFEKHDLPFIEPIMGAPVGWYTTEIGPLNQVIQMWAFQDLNDRERRRAQVMAHPQWPRHLEMLEPLVVAQSSILLRPANFFLSRLAVFGPK
jgi:hypothetical protein